MRKHLLKKKPYNNRFVNVLFANPWIPHAWPRLQVLFSLYLCAVTHLIISSVVALYSTTTRSASRCPTLRPVCMRYRDVHHIIDANDPNQRRVWVVPQTRASHNGTEPRSLKVCSKCIQRLELVSPRQTKDSMEDNRSLCLECSLVA